MNYTKAKQLGERYYNGAVCFHHPDQEGHRLVSNGACVQCNADKIAVLGVSKNEETAKARKQKYEAARRARRRTEIRANRLTDALVEGRIYLAARLCAQDIAVKAGNPSAWRHSWLVACDMVNLEIRKMALPWVALNPRDLYDVRKIRTEDDWNQIFNKRPGT
jgi:hypothetical protein